MTYTHLTTLILVCIGGVNWGLVGLANFDLVAALLGDMSILSRIVYLLVGVSAVYQLVGASRCLKATA
ncbi:hypothetical protein XMM379_002390 [Aliiroseovarius sp. xm-m-379]|uniref:DUF378 domain-containing protein n=1 Tax=unclassified Aliiroseovarius TaxID=2623558 RepID=UPI001568D8DB|nr:MULTISPECIES: DUF378 domain-containing protein [unclassified Aliiroseovarius]NRP11696.1 hypothetical protein [Aliiroseovarius sp. xm-d-517]NRP25691.1 hypothetical protein [Aliiroseovarius sp. xm-m-379]NRP31197.1 hypothetical protein [Aliiroseovarius sp. xm-m-314]NRP34490.1 hypothetical protein [Aliiroseovarius sp. xm-a-104]NRP41925.1 hypothetical protein [Aliiroseovarius sp. xm-m-339-2]